MASRAKAKLNAPNSALVLFAHGARDPQWAEPFSAIRESVSRRRPDLTVALAFLELMQPRLHECVAQLVQAGHERIIIAPMFLAQGGHLKENLPRLIGDLNACHSSVEISVLPAIGEVHNLLEAIAQSLVEGLPRADR